MIVAVTGFVPIPGHPRAEAEYRALGGRLCLAASASHSILKIEADLSRCWLSSYLPELDGFDHAVADNPGKNSVDYHIVQAQKIAWVAETVDALPMSADDVVCWIDFGIFHIPEVTEQIIQDFLRRAATERAIAIPGCWDRQHGHDDRWPNWRFCGGIVVMPCRYVSAFDTEIKREYMRCLGEEKLLTWEINIWARVEQRCPELPIWQYRAASHDASMFTHYQTTENADGREKQGAPLRGLEERPR